MLNGLTQIELTLPDFVVYSDGLYVNRLRKYLNDTAELNILEQKQESTDSDLNMAIKESIIEINTEFQPETTYPITTIPWTMTRAGAVIQVLIMKGILSARNTLNYSDAGGIQVSNYDKYGRYVNYYNILINKFQASVARWKLNKNIEAGWGGINSEYEYTEDL